MKIIKVNPDNINLQHLREAADVILKGGIIAYPTETVYGLGANAFDESAVERIFELKQRDKSKPILVIASTMEQITNLTSSIPECALTLAREFWPGPLTIVFKASSQINEILASPKKTIGIRIPDNKICAELLMLCGVPLTSTSANVSGGQNPISITEVISNFNDTLDLILDGGIARSRIPSTVVDVSHETPILKREGIIKKEALEQFIKLGLDET